MFQIQGAIVVVPTSVDSEPGFLQASEDSPQEPAIILTWNTEVGPVITGIPLKEIDKLTDVIEQAKAKAKDKPSNIYVPTSEKEVEDFANQIGKVNNATRD